MEIVVRFRSAAAQQLQTDGRLDDVPGLVEVVAVVKQHGMTLRPQHPGVQDAALQTYFVIPDAPPETAEAIAAALRALPAVEAAYAKPPISPA